MSRGSYLARTAGGTRKDPTQSGGDRYAIDKTF